MDPEVIGTGPDVVLIHGTGSGALTWRGLVPRLARHYRLVIPELPGHGRAAAPRDAGYGLSDMAAAVGRSLDAVAARPVLLVGHSAGAAVAAWWSLQSGRRIPLIALAPALLGFVGWRHSWYSGLARLLAMQPWLPGMVAWRAADRGAVERLIRGVGSTLDADGIDAYVALLRRPCHVASVLQMMAQWDLTPLAARLHTLADDTLLVTGARDRAVTSADVARLQQRMPGVARVDVADAGHLLHEERPDAVLDALRGWALGRGLAL